MHDDKHIGLLWHRTLVTTPERTPLCLMINQQTLYHNQENDGNKHPRQPRPIDSYQWIVSLEATATIQTASPATLIVNVAAREGDLSDAFQYAKESGPSLLVRAAGNRAIASEEKSRWEHLESRHAQDEPLEVSVPRHDKRPARRAKLSVRYRPIRWKPPSHRKVEKLPSIKVDAVLVQAESPPPGEEPIEWLRLTMVPVNRVEDAKERVPCPAAGPSRLTTRSLTAAV